MYLASTVPDRSWKRSSSYDSKTELLNLLFSQHSHVSSGDSPLEQGFGVSTDAVATISALLAPGLGVGLASSSRLGLACIHVLIMLPISSHACCASLTCPWSSSASLLIRQMGWYEASPWSAASIPAIQLCSSLQRKLLRMAAWAVPWNSRYVIFVLRTFLKDFNYVHG